MSESAVNIIYFSVALISFLITAGKAHATWRDFRRGGSARDQSLLVITSATFWGAVAFVVMSPVVYRALGSASGLPALASLLAYLCVFGFAAHQHILVILWRRQSEDPAPRQPTRSVPAYGAVYVLLAAAMVALFLGIEAGPADPMTFDVTYAHGSTAFYFLLVYVLAVCFALWNAVSECARAAKSMSHAATRRGLRLIRIGSTIILLSFVQKAIGFTAVALGQPAWGVLDTISPLVGTIGAYFNQAGYLGPALEVWLHVRRDLRRLRPLWNLTVPGNALQLAPPGPLTEMLGLNSRFHLRRRIVEISDAFHMLRPWMTGAPAIEARQVGAAEGLPAEETEALAAAATVAEALARKWCGEPARSHESLQHFLPRVAPSQQRAHLVRIAQALTHPLATSLLDVGRAVEPARTAESAAGLPGTH